MANDDRLPEFMRQASQPALVRYRFLIWLTGEEEPEEIYGSACTVMEGSLLVIEIRPDDTGYMVFGASEGTWDRFKRMEPLEAD